MLLRLRLLQARCQVTTEVHGERDKPINFSNVKQNVRFSKPHNTWRFRLEARCKIAERYY